MRYGLSLKDNRKGGFTLVELLVVISIIALLLSILMPSLSRARKQAQAVQCASNLKQLGLGWYMYANQWDDYFPAGMTWDAVTDQLSWLAWWKKYCGISDYLPGKTAFDLRYEDDEQLAYPGWYCPSHMKDAVNNSIAVGYHFNFNIGYYRCANVAKISQSAEVPLLFGFWDPNPVTSSYGTEYLGNYFSKAASEPPPYGEETYEAFHFTPGVRSVHGEIGTNFLLVDGHAERIKPLDTQIDYGKKFRWGISRNAYKEIPLRGGPSGW